METEAPEVELEDEAAALPPASSSSTASPLWPPEDIKPRQEELAGPERRPRRSSPRARVMTASGAHLEHEAPGRQHAVEVGSYSDFTALMPALCPPQPPPYASRPRRRPRGVHGASDADDGIAGATRSCDRHLVGPVIPATAPLVVAVAPLLVTLARGGAFAVGGAIHAAAGPDAEAPEGLDGEEVLPHQLKMEGEPLRQAVDPGERLPPSAQIHHAGGSGLDVDSRTTDPAAPHAQVQHLRLLHLQQARERSGKAEAAARRPTQPDDELAGVVPKVGRGKKRGRRRRRGRRADPSTSSASAPSTTSSTTSPSPPSPNSRLRRRGCKGRRGALPSGHPCCNRRRTRVPPLHCRWGKETRS